MNGLAAQVQTTLAENPFSGHVFAFRGRRGDLVKLLWWSGDGLCLFHKRLERGRFVWPQATSGSVSLTPAQLSMLLDASTGDIRNAQRKLFALTRARMRVRVLHFRACRTRHFPMTSRR